MSKPINKPTTLDHLKKFTPARINLPRAGSSICTQEILDFDLAHARVRDAVHLPFNIKSIAQQLCQRKIECHQVRSEATDRYIYLQRPDLGRRLAADSRQLLENAQASFNSMFDLGICIADGLSARAIHCNAISFLDHFLPLASGHGWTCAPVILASQARVAIADEIGEILKVGLSVILIGERPGLTASDSMGIYVTWAPKNGRLDAERNCISNIREGGLTLAAAARQLESFLNAAFRLRLTGVHLKTDKSMGRLI